MKKRVNINLSEPLAYKAMMGLESYLEKVDVPQGLQELMKIRSSQINNCAFCLNMHTKEAVKNNESYQRLFLVSAWREAGDIFTPEEQVVLAMAEEITLVSQHGLTDETYAKAAEIFTETQIAQIIMVIVTINAWNRIEVSCRQRVAKD